MAAAAKRLAITPRIASKTGFVDVSNTTHGSKFRCFGSTAAASGVLKEEKESKKMSILERRVTLEAFVNQYRASNAGRFPTASYVKKQIGGSYYTARQIIQELEFNHKMSLVGKHNGSHVGKTKQDNNPAMLLKEVSAPSEVEEISKPVVSENCVSSKDIDRRSKIRTKDSTIANVDQMVINDELLDRKEPSVSATVGTSSVKKAVKYANSTPRKKNVGSTENSSINGVASSGTHMTTNLPGIGSTSRLANESLQDSVHDYKREEADLLVSLKLETTVDTLHLSHLLSEEEDNKNRKSTEHLHDTNGPKQIEQIDNLESPESEGCIGDPPKKVEIRESSPTRSDIWGNLRALANGFVNFWKKM